MLSQVQPGDAVFFIDLRRSHRKQAAACSNRSSSWAPYQHGAVTAWLSNRGTLSAGRLVVAAGKGRLQCSFLWDVQLCGGKGTCDGVAVCSLLPAQLTKSVFTLPYVYAGVIVVCCVFWCG